MALSPKERENIIEEESLRFETRRNLQKKSCAERPVRWPWVILGLLLVYGLWSHIFCRSYGMGHGCPYMQAKSCHSQGMMWAPDEKDEGAGQPVKPGQK